MVRRRREITGCSTPAVCTLRVRENRVRFPAARLNVMKEGDCPSVVRRLADEGGQPDHSTLFSLLGLTSLMVYDPHYI